MPSTQADLQPDAAGILSLAAQIPLDLTQAQADQLAAYAHLLTRWNAVHNLTAIRTPAELLTHHLIDSLAALPAIEAALAQNATAPGNLASTQPIFLDAGSGGGLPGIPLAIARPLWRFRLVDAVEKKTAFLQQAIATLRLPGVRARHERLEAAPDPTEALADVAISRAFTSLGDFTRLTRHRLQPGGLWLAMKGKRPDAEMGSLPPTVEVVNVVTLHVPRLEEARHLIVMRPRAPDGSAPADL